MPPRDWKVRIDDILDAMARIQRYTSGMSLEQFRSDEKTVDAVVRSHFVGKTPKIGGKNGGGDQDGPAHHQR